jgi:hypothetical protein
MDPLQRKVPTPAEKIALATGALIGWLGVALQFYVLMQNHAGISTSEAVVRFFSFFTILTNLFVAAGYTFPLLAPASAPGRYFASASARGSAAVYIVVVGVVYTLLLSQLYHPHGWAKFADILVHDVAPIFYVVYWFIFASKEDLRWKDAAAWLAYPLAYLLWTLLRGALVSYYPYPFMNVTTLGYPRVFFNAAILTIVFWALGFIVILIARVMTPVSTSVQQPATETE